ncbi:Uma2 family endonuclease [Streptomyces sp. RPA4-5]|uniref:Uma2 family endonuclease n=1 Tax=Streptomyces sp. RPA4-5 TaxID=2721245 RepID=UPI001B3C4F1B|nr:Uma2 family endonuclease [Streptomyces sp. RPA4-5]
MIALTAEHFPEEGRVWDALVRIWEDTEAPEACMVEIVDGIVTVAPPRDVRQNVIVAELSRALYQQALPENRGAYQKLALAVPARKGLYVPNLVVAPDSVVRGPGRFIPAAAAELVVEITSMTSAVHDRLHKPAGYASAGVPLYLLIDLWSPDGPTATLHGEPDHTRYRNQRSARLGERLHLPEPFDMTIDTSLFRVS